MNTHQLPLRNSEQAKGIVVPQIGFDREGQLGNVVDGMDVARLQADLVELPLIKRHLFIGGPHHFQQPRRLDGVEIIAGGALDFRGIHGHGGSTPCFLSMGRIRKYAHMVSNRFILPQFSPLRKTRRGHSFGKTGFLVARALTTATRPFPTKLETGVFIFTSGYSSGGCTARRGLPRRCRRLS